MGSSSRVAGGDSARDSGIQVVRMLGAGEHARERIPAGAPASSCGAADRARAGGNDADGPPGPRRSVELVRPPLSRNLWGPVFAPHLAQHRAALADGDVG